MPLYDFECSHCEYCFDAVLPVSECDDIQLCPVCSSVSSKVISLGHGGIVRTGDSVPWVRDVAKVLTDNDNPNPNIETVQDLRNYYKANPNIRPVESHPALPSSYGDAKDAGKVDKKHVLAERSRKGHEVIRKMRSIEVN